MDGQRLRQARRWFGLTQKEVCHLYQEVYPDAKRFEQNTWSDWENGKSSPDSDLILRRVADMLCVSLDWLIGVEGAEMRSARVLNLRRLLCAHIKGGAVPGGSATDRFVWALDRVKEHLDGTVAAMHPEKLLDTEEERFREYMAGEHEQELQGAGYVAQRLSAFLRIPALHEWIASGEWSHDNIPLEWLDVGIRAQSIGLRPDTIAAHLDFLLEKQRSNDRGR